MGGCCSWLKKKASATRVPSSTLPISSTSEISARLSNLNRKTSPTSGLKSNRPSNNNMSRPSSRASDTWHNTQSKSLPNNVESKAFIEIPISRRQKSSPAIKPKARSRSPKKVVKSQSKSRSPSPRPTVIQTFGVTSDIIDPPPDWADQLDINNNEVEVENNNMSQSTQSGKMFTKIATSLSNDIVVAKVEVKSSKVSGSSKTSGTTGSKTSTPAGSTKGFATAGTRRASVAPSLAKPPLPNKRSSSGKVLWSKPGVSPAASSVQEGKTPGKNSTSFVTGPPPVSSFKRRSTIRKKKRNSSASSSASQQSGKCVGCKPIIPRYMYLNDPGTHARIEFELKNAKMLRNSLRDWEATHPVNNFCQKNRHRNSGCAKPQSQPQAACVNFEMDNYPTEKEEEHFYHDPFEYLPEKRQNFHHHRRNSEISEISEDDSHEEKDNVYFNDPRDYSRKKIIKKRKKKTSIASSGS